METDKLYTGPHQVIDKHWFSCAPFGKLLGMKIVEALGGRSHLTMPFTYQLAQGEGLVHGGAIVSLADTSVAMAVKSLFPPGSRFGTISLRAEFLRPVTKGVLAAKAEVKIVEDRLIQGTATVFDEEMRPVMEFSAMFKLGREVKVPRSRQND